MNRSNPSHATMERFLKVGFTIGDVAEPLVSFDAESPTEAARALMLRRGFDAVGIRQDGLVNGYVTGKDLNGQCCGAGLRSFADAMAMESDTPLHLVVPVLDEFPRVFVACLGTVGGIVTREDLEKPVARMWLFGLVTLIEMAFIRLMENRYPDDRWRDLLPAGRIGKAVALQMERERKKQRPTLFECLHFADRGHIVFQDEQIRRQFGFESRTAATRALKRVERLRNNLAHAQGIASGNWTVIVRFSMNMDRILALLTL